MKKARGVLGGESPSSEFSREIRKKEIPGLVQDLLQNFEGDQNFRNVVSHIYGGYTEFEIALEKGFRLGLSETYIKGTGAGVGSGRFKLLPNSPAKTTHTPLTGDFQSYLKYLITGILPSVIYYQRKEVDSPPTNLKGASKAYIAYLVKQDREKGKVVGKCEKCGVVGRLKRIFPPNKIGSSYFFCHYLSPTQQKKNKKRLSKGKPPLFITCCDLVMSHGFMCLDHKKDWDIWKRRFLGITYEGEKIASKSGFSSLPCTIKESPHLPQVWLGKSSTKQKKTKYKEGAKSVKMKVKVKVKKQLPDDPFWRKEEEEAEKRFRDLLTTKHSDEKR